MAIACATSARASMVAIDDFSTPAPSQFFLVASGNNPSQQISNQTNSAIGGQRDMLISVAGQASLNSAVGIVGHDPYYGLDALQIGTNGTAPTIVAVQYSGLNNLNTNNSLVNAHSLGGGAGVDLTAGGVNDRFWMHFFHSDAQPTIGLDVTITITSVGGGLSTVLANAPNSTTAFDLYVPFDKLSGNASLTAVDSIIYKFNSVRQTSNVDFGVQLLAVVPEPGSAALAAIACVALAGAAWRERRRRRNARPAG